MALGKNRSKINVKGYGYLLARQISPSPSDTFVDFGYVQETTLVDERTTIDAMDERGLLVDSIDGDQKVTLTSQLMQSDIDVLNFLKAASGKYYDVYYYGLTADGKYQEFRMYVCKVKPGINISLKANTLRNVPLEIRGFPVKSAFTATPTAFNIAQNDIYVFIENATQQGPPTDTATAVASACL